MGLTDDRGAIALAEHSVPGVVDAIVVESEPVAVGQESESHPQVLGVEGREVLVQCVTIGDAQHMDQMRHGCSFSGVPVVTDYHRDAAPQYDLAISNVIEFRPAVSGKPHARP
jgi:hypothetical protein